MLPVLLNSCIDYLLKGNMTCVLLLDIGNGGLRYGVTNVVYSTSVGGSSSGAGTGTASGHTGKREYVSSYTSRLKVNHYCIYM